MTPHDRRYFWGPEVAEVIKREKADVDPEEVWEAIQHPHAGSIEAIKHKKQGCFAAINYLKEKGII